MKFELQHNDTKSNARAGLITTDHGVIETPIFMPVGTQGTVKGVHMTELEEDINAQIILGNTYHLYLRPGLEILEQAGGLHKFNTWNRPILTDSGGFQVFSLSENRKLHEEGAMFRSHIDGSKHLFTPEKVMDIQRIIGADIIMAFDECCPGDADYEYAKKSLGLTERWLDRCFERFNSTEPKYGYQQSLFPIVQGCVYPELRRKAAENVAEKGADGNAIGGLAVGEPTEKMYEMIEVVNEILPKDKPRFLMGVGTPIYILEGIERGIDMFDCIMPTNISIPRSIPSKILIGVSICSTASCRRATDVTDRYLPASARSICVIRNGRTTSLLSIRMLIRLSTRATARRIYTI